MSDFISKLLTMFGVFSLLLQVFQVKKMSGTDTGKIFAMKVLKKVSQYSGI